MTKQDAIRKLKYLQNHGEGAKVHANADTILCDFLDAVGHVEIAREFRKVHASSILGSRWDISRSPGSVAVNEFGERVAQTREEGNFGDPARSFRWLRDADLGQYLP